MKKQIITFIICGLVIFVLGAGVGFIFQKQETPVQLQPDQNLALVKVLSSKVVPLYATGIVTKINGLNITLTSDGDSLTVPIKSNAVINLFVQPSADKTGVAPAPFYQSVKFDSIKIGDRLNINLILSSDNKLIGQTVYIFSPVPGAE